MEGEGRGAGGREERSRRVKPSCQLLLQQLLPLLFPQGLQVVRPLQGRLSEEREIFIHATIISPKLCFLINPALTERLHQDPYLMLLPEIIDSFFLLQDSRLHSGKTQRRGR